MIKTGYLIQITTWENDADNYSTKSYDGLTYNKCLFMAELCKLFASRYSGLKGFGNSETSNSKVYEAYRQLLVNFEKEHGQVPVSFDEIEDDYISDALYDIIGMWGEGEYWRVVESYKVYHVKQPIEEVVF